MPENAEKKSTSVSSAKKCLNDNYQKLRVNVRKEKLEQWKAYAESKGKSMYALVHELFENAMTADGFSPAENSNSESEE